ncbi:GNAT family N-acetyltransferase [Shewanella sp. OPT22]|nr:GNAT family N-acetyltransferase [Shewanella sp. OPT22]
MIFTVDKVVKENLPKIEQKPWLAKPTKTMLKYLLNEKECNEIAMQHAHLTGVDFVEKVLESFNFNYSVPNTEIENIPCEGRVVIFANHPIGSLDALAMIKLISKVRSDIKVVANDLLMALGPLHNILLPVKNMTGGTPKQNLTAIHEHLKSEGAVLIFPSGEVSRLRPQGVRDTSWQSGFYKMACTCNAPLLPMFADAKNSAAFYGASMIYKPLATLMLVKEMFKQSKKTMPIRIGELIPIDAFKNNDFPLKVKIKLLKNHLYRVGRNRQGLFNTQSPISHPESRADLQHALNQCEQLGETADGKLIYLYEHKDSSPIMREVGRLREIAFRAVGEGTGERRDTDKYDPFYLHLILWDKSDLEIVGAYRFAKVDDVHQRVGRTALYSQSLFSYTPEFDSYFEKGLELGRSFVQPKYWGKRSLEYLWYGIGAFLQKHPQYRYLFGPVSLSGQLPERAKVLLVHFYQTQFLPCTCLANSKSPYMIPTELKRSLDTLYDYSSNDKDTYNSNFRILKQTLSELGVAVPTLFKQYSELCKPGGVKFLDFGVDTDFNDCIDGLVLVDLEKLLPKKKAKYIEP